MSEDYKDIGEAIYEGLDSMLALVHTNSIGQIKSFNRNLQTCVVQPVLKARREGVAEAEPLPPIEDVPVMFVGSGDFWITVDLKPGSYVALLCGERSIATWVNAGGIVDPELRQKFQLSDAIAFAGINPIPSALIPGVAADSLEIRNRLGTVVTHLEATKLKLTAPTIEINGSTDFAVAFTDLKAGFDTLLADFNNLAAYTVAHVHTGPGVPPSPPVPPIVVPMPSIASVDASKVPTVKLP